jgi:hypothetical protein
VEVSFIGGGHWQTLSHNVVSSKPGMIGIRTHNIIVDSTTIWSIIYWYVYYRGNYNLWAFNRIPEVKKQNTTIII